jgi:uncharacterized membrane protein affecting hemolysin expression
VTDSAVIWTAVGVVVVAGAVYWFGAQREATDAATLAQQQRAAAPTLAGAAQQGSDLGGQVIGLIGQLATAGAGIYQNQQNINAAAAQREALRQDAGGTRAPTTRPT